MITESDKRPERWALSLATRTTNRLGELERAKLLVIIATIVCGNPVSR
jgi:hypothetical protein